MLSLCPPFLLLAVFSVFTFCDNEAARQAHKAVRARYPWWLAAQEAGTVPVSPMERTAASKQRSGKPVWTRNPTMEFQMQGGRLRRRKLLSTRYKSIFGHSKTLRGSEYIPANLASYTGKLATSRREIFKWGPKDVEQTMLFPKTK